MNFWQQWAQYIHQMQREMEVQSRKIVEMEKSIVALQTSMVALQTEMKSWKEQKRIHIDKVEYKFDQLKVEKLDGTLNIGVTPGALEDIAVNGSSVTTEYEAAKDADITQIDSKIKSGAELPNELARELKIYVEKQVPKQLGVLQAQYGEQLDSWHQKMIVEDLLKQTDARIDYYLRQMTPGATVDQLSSIQDAVLFRTQNDIRAAVDSYYNKFISKKAGES
ncbi:spore germination protein GerPC [Paenibacillus radicis (ex Xue et al. 2023)]|uniref:Spore germination protein GerPC n=1 Tax=Paenibacillus radicis (ex Xue et al. 2023) TaxID=2972489 RepID=A0ABT1YE68_9BACL|nr:spore germination protein GerPC [Paenibacillus radicis (ex Xue et al. 2023)]MCR8630719.1 spore germination protein GerPC [Paenibacillus radicis (ex Xue et al. 2023)]